MKDTVFCNLTPFGLIACTGKNTLTFLQGQLTNDLNKLSQEKIQLAAYCNPQGRVIATMLVLYQDETIYLQMPASIIEQCLAHLKKYAVFSRVNCYNATEELAIIGVYGQNARELIPTLKPKQIYKIPGTSSRFEIIIPKQEFEAVKQLLDLAAQEVNPDFWRLLDIDCGIPTIYPETQEQFLPHRINYHLIGGISFTKGCFVGQEIIARMQYRGTLKHHMYRIELQCGVIPQKGTALYLTKESSSIGNIVDCVLVENQTYRALAILSIDHAVDNKLFVGEDFQEATMKILDLPYSFG